MAERDTSTTRLAMVGIVCISLFASLFVRLWYLQVVDDSGFQVAANSINLRVIHAEGTRGRILDRNGKVLVDNRTSIVVSIDRTKIKDDTPEERTEVFQRLAGVLTDFGFPVKAPVIQQRYDDLRYGPLELVPVKSEVTEDVELYIAEHADDFPGVVVKRTAVRSYPYGDLAAHIVGYVGQINDKELSAKKEAGLTPDDSGRSVGRRDHKTYAGGDEIGKSGVEATAEGALRGVPGDQVIQVDARGDYVTTVEEAKPEAGDDVWLTIDIDLQAMAEDMLSQRLAELRAGGTDKDGRPIRAPQGSIVIMDPQSGDILAMASFPSYDPALLVNGIDSALWEDLTSKAKGQKLFNWALQGQYAPGSTFKLFSGTAALESGMLGAGDRQIQDPGYYKVQGCKGGKCEFQNSGRARHGTVGIEKSLTVSSDVFYYWIGDTLWQQRSTLGDQYIQDTAARFGLGSKTGIDLPGEAKGRLPTPSWLREVHEARPDVFTRGDWFAGDNLNTAIGQGDVLVTPLQLADAYATFANGGTRYRPQIISKITRPDDVGADPADPDNHEVISTTEPEQLGSVTFTGDHYQRLLQGLTGVVTQPGGTAYSSWKASQTAWPMAGKTGTAEVNGKADTSLFVAFGPVDPVVKPQYAISVIIPEAGFGSDVSAPLAFRIMKPVSQAAVPETITDRDRAWRDARTQKLLEMAAAAAAASPSTTLAPPPDGSATTPPGSVDAGTTTTIEAPR